ncbi:methyltransferase domain-containing protein [Candidatus Parcubacteria bacterium]|nr:methyltransferase domain-containing protein [Patescibacteria group bacterium]MBU4476894.1 methyltransferase domain-containing protein [Patescibacteria group bacterium]MCG2699085.1 methyltransferase domain-containing protein [Candidatus Parcubacteria bacterium]
MLSPKFWNRYFKVYDILNLVIPYQELLITVCEKLNIRRGEKILDAGAGTGNLAILLEKKGARIIGLDFSQEALNIYESKNSKAEVLLADLTKKLPFADSYFDKIVSINVLFLIDRETRKKVAKEFYRIIKPNGKIVLVNLIEEFRPSRIYLEHFKKIGKQKGIIATVIQIFKFIPASLKILYYANKLKKTGQQKQILFNYDEQKELLKKTGFRNISENKKVYANQAILNSALK